MAYRQSHGQMRQIDDPSKYLYNIPEGEAEEEEVQIIGVVQDGVVQDDQQQDAAGGVSKAVREIIGESAVQLEDLKRTLRKFLEDNLDDFSGKIAQSLWHMGYANTDQL